MKMDFSRLTADQESALEGILTMCRTMCRAQCRVQRGVYPASFYEQGIEDIRGKMKILEGENNGNERNSDDALGLGCRRL